MRRCLAVAKLQKRASPAHKSEKKTRHTLVFRNDKNLNIKYLDLASMSSQQWETMVACQGYRVPIRIKCNIARGVKKNIIKKSILEPSPAARRASLARVPSSALH